MNEFIIHHRENILPFLFMERNGKVSVIINSSYIPPIKDIKKCVNALDRLLKEAKEMGEKEIEKYNAKKRKEIEQENKRIWEEMDKEDKRSEENKVGFIYLLKSRDLYKIGITENFKKRMKSYTTENPFGVKVILLKRVKNYHKKETEILDRFHHKVYRGEWMKLNKDDVKEIEKIIDRP